MTNEVNAQVGANIKRLRKKLDISSTTLADAINVSQSTISGWETGNVFPRSEAIEKMELFFGVDKSEPLIDEREAATDIEACILSKPEKIIRGVIELSCKFWITPYIAV